MGYERPEANFIFRGALSREHAAKEPVLDPKADRAEAPRRAEKAWRAGVMAVDIARVRSGIGIKLTPPSLFCKELSIRRHFMQILRRAWSLSTRWLTALP